VAGVAESKFLCQNCDYVGSIEDDSIPSEISCSVCGECECVYAIHINTLQRMKWIDIENKSSRFKEDKKLRKSFRADLVLLRDKDDFEQELIKSYVDIGHSIVKQINDMNPEQNFPEYRIHWDKERPNRRRKGWKGFDQRKTREGRLRGELYEGLFRKSMDILDYCKRNLETIENTNENSCTPDGWIELGRRDKIPVEFKTVGKEKMTQRGIVNHLKQSRKQGDIVNDVLNTRNWWSLLILLSPEERRYVVLLMDHNLDSRIKHLSS